MQIYVCEFTHICPSLAPQSHRENEIPVTTNAFAPRSWSVTPFSNKRKEGLKEIADSEM